MFSRKDWINEIENGSGAICFHPEWLKQGCPKCGGKKWYLLSLTATCENPKCKFSTETLYPFFKTDLEEKPIPYKMTVDGV